MPSGSTKPFASRNASRIAIGYVPLVGKHVSSVPVGVVVAVGVAVAVDVAVALGVTVVVGVALGAGIRVGSKPSVGVDVGPARITIGRCSGGASEPAELGLELYQVRMASAIRTITATI